MLSEKIYAKHLLDLKSIATILKEINIHHEIVDRSEEIQLTTLYVELPAKDKDMPYQLYLAFIPTSEDDLDFAKLLQIYADVSSINDHEDRIALNTKIVELNNEVLFGRFGISGDKILYRYVLNIPQYFEFETNYLIELFELLVYTIESNVEELK